MAVAGGPWQLEFENVEQRCAHLLTSGRLADCTFMVGSGTIPAHKLVLAMASPVFEEMFYGSEHNDPRVSIPDVPPEAFKALLRYIYTGNIDIGSFDMACDLWSAAKKYMPHPHLVKQCTSYISSAVGPRNVCRAYELAHLFEEKTVIDKCIQIISTNTKEVLKDSSFVDVELKTLITVCSLEHLTVDSELDLFHAVARYAEEQRRRGQISPPEEEGPPSKKLRKSLHHSSTCEDKELFPSVASSSKTSPATELDSQPPPEVGTSEPTADKQHLKEDEPSIRAALQQLRFLSLTFKQFAEGPARSALLTKDESFAVFMNIASRDSPVPMPPGFSECRERRQPQNAQCFEAGSLDHTINALKCGDPSQVEDAAEAARDILRNEPPDIQPALDKGILDALVPALTEGSDGSKKHAADAIYWLCARASPAQLRVLAEGAALQPYCRLLAATGGSICYWVLEGLKYLLEKVDQSTKPDLLQKLRALGVPQLLIPLKQHTNPRVNQLKELIRRIDLPLHSHLVSHGVDYLQFSFRWMNNLLTREIPLSCTIRLWDTYLAESDGFATFQLYVCAAFLLHWRERLLLERDFQGLMILLQNVPTQNWVDSNISLLVAEAYRLKFAFADAPNHLTGQANR